MPATPHNTPETPLPPILASADAAPSADQAAKGTGAGGLVTAGARAAGRGRDGDGIKIVRVA